MVIKELLSGQSTFTTNIKIPVSSILLKCEKEGGSSLADEEVEIWLRRNTGKDILLIEKTSILDFFEENCENDEIYIDTKGLSIGLISLTPDPEVGLKLDPSNNEYIEVKFTNLRTSYEYSFYGVETFETSNIAVNFDKKIHTNTREKFDVSNADQMFLPITSLNKVVLTDMESGKTVEVTNSELNLMTSLNGEVKKVPTLNIDTKKLIVTNTLDMFTKKSYVTVDVSEVEQVEVFAVAGYELGILGTQSI